MGKFFSAMAGHCFVLFLMLRWASWILKSGANTRGLKTRPLNTRKLDSWITVVKTKVFPYPSSPCRLRYVCIPIICITQYTAHFLVYNQFQHRATTADAHFYHFEIDKLILYLFWKKKEHLNGDKKKSLCVLIFFYFCKYFFFKCFHKLASIHTPDLPVALALIPDPQWHLQCHFL